MLAIRFVLLDFFSRGE